MRTYYAHSTENTDKIDWQPLSEHLLNVAELAERFAAVFGAGMWGKSAGLLHDAGKATTAFIGRLEGKSQRVDHSTFGARLARDQAGKLGLLLAYVVAGHHGGLPDGGAQETELHFRLKHGKVPDDVELLPEVTIHNELLLPFKLTREHPGFCLSFFTRMLFSCLTDADFLDTEAFCAPQQAQARLKSPDGELFANLQQRLDNFLNEKIQNADQSPVNDLRQQVLTQCRNKAKLPQQIFTLNVPTGGGKTLSSLAFALGHAVAHNLQRVIYAIPFTSIIEQNAKVFQEALGQEHILEHHCNYKERDTLEENGYDRQRGLAAENWDMPVVVTTNVQFFESLFSNKPSRCRKLHNIARSVIILDEAQAIPTEYLEPCLGALRVLVEQYGCSVVLCTATQPAFDNSSSLRMAFREVVEIVDDPELLHKELRRTEVQFIGQLSDVELADRLAEEQQVLCIVSTKAQARSVFSQLPRSEGTFHLSTNMYPQHRRRILETIRTRLKNEETCRVVSTSLVEAGVDLDFPVVYRAMAGLDSLAQAAGRCNREGKMQGKLGKVLVYESEQPPRMPWIKRCVARAKETLRTMPEAAPLSLETMRRYFELLYDVQDLDKKQIVTLLDPPLEKELIFPFKEVAQSFRFIEDETIGVIVAKEPKAVQLVKELRRSMYPRTCLRKLQQYTVAVRLKELAILERSGAIEMIRETYPVLCNEAVYEDNFGFCLDSSEVWNPEQLNI
jgi:CRISPR-associated endonuclease/helicase Cas3